MAEYLSTQLCSHCATRAPVGREATFRCANILCCGGSHCTSDRDVDAAVAIWRIAFGNVCRLFLAGWESAYVQVYDCLCLSVSACVCVCICYVCEKYLKGYKT